MAVDERPAPTAPGDGRLRLVRAVAAAEFELIPLGQDSDPITSYAYRQVKR